ncbi:MAG: hypothetical protein WCL19_05210 [Verrucomicrobiota bacterium]
MAEPQNPSWIGGCFSKLLFLILLVGLIGLGGAVYWVSQPQSLSDLGANNPRVVALPQRDLKVVVQSAIDGNSPLTLSETELNQWLGRTLAARQGGLLGEKVTLDRVWIRLEKGRAEVILVRSLWGKPFTVSMFLGVEQVDGPDGSATVVALHGGPYLKAFPNPPQGGRFGRLVVPQGLLVLVLPAYERLATAYREEIELCLRHMVLTRIEKGRVILNPPEPSPQGLRQSL